MPNRVLIAILLSLGLFLLPGGVEGSDWNGTEQVTEGVRHVRNPSRSMAGTSIHEPEELWRIGGFSEDKDELFGSILHVLVDEQDHVYILDSQLSEVRVFSIEGEYVHSIGREGEGPGEFRHPNNMLFTPDGKLGVIQPFPSKMVLFDAERNPAGEYAFRPPERKGFLRLVSGKRAGNQLALLYEIGNKDKGSWSTTVCLGLFDLTGAQQSGLIEATSRMSFAEAHFVEREWSRFDQCWTASPDGRVFARGGFTDYEVRVWDAGGKLERVIHRDYPPHRRQAEDIERIEEQRARRFGWLKNASFDIEENWAPVHDLYAHDDGTLWVRTSRGWRDLEEGVMARFDVFDRDGRYVQEIALRGELDPENDGFFLERGYAIVVTDLVSALYAFKGVGYDEDVTEEPEPMSVICYRLPLQKIAAKTGD